VEVVGVGGELSWFDLITGLLGGVVIFLLGFERMTKAMQSAAGSRLADGLARVSERPALGALSGAGVTAVIQSSSVTTVLTVGFVSAGLMTLTQALGVIAGANLGTTVTAQIIAFDVTRFAMLMIAVGFALSFDRRRPTLRQAGGALLGLGLVFLGMDLMGAAVSPLRDQPQVLELFRGAGGPLAALALGAGFTALVQSSSATIGIVIVLASQGLVDLPSAIAIALGAKIGTCVTAGIASVGAGTEAKRAATFHVLLNLGGALVWVPLIGVLTDLAVWLSPSFPELTGTARLAAETPRQVANAYTIFAAVNLLVVIWFIRPVARWLQWLIKEAPYDPFASAHHLRVDMLGTPAAALELVRQEIKRLGHKVVAMVRLGGNAAICGDQGGLEAIATLDDDVDELRGAIVTYLAELAQREISRGQSAEIARLLAAADELESIGDVVETGLVRLGHRLHDERIVMSESTAVVIGELLEEISRNLEEAVVAVGEADRKGVTALLDRAPDVKARREAAMSRQAVRLADQGPGRAGAYAREVELISEIYRIHTLTKRLLRRQLTASIELGGEPEEAEAAAAPSDVGPSDPVAPPSDPVAPPSDPVAPPSGRTGQ
jgi:phosphate:Na+ symporter